MPRLRLLALGERCASIAYNVAMLSIAVQYKYDICGDHTV